MWNASGNEKQDLFRATHRALNIIYQPLVPQKYTEWHEWAKAFSSLHLTERKKYDDSLYFSRCCAVFFRPDMIKKWKGYFLGRITINNNDNGNNNDRSKQKIFFDDSVEGKTICIRGYHDESFRVWCVTSPIHKEIANALWLYYIT